jgi:DnaJ-class molecular chaperone
MFTRNYYDILGVSVTASPREIRQAFRRLAREYSPDIAIGDERAATLFVEIEEAYQVLSDPTRRTFYDDRGQRGSPGRKEPGFAPARTSPRGSDLHRTVELPFEGALRGSTIRLPIVREARCEACGGSGVRVYTDPCPRCLGSGLAARQEEVEVSIPPGVDTGFQLRIPGKGNDGPRGGPAGDIIVLTRIQPHPFFERKGDNLYCEIPITVPEAILGARISVPTPDGTTVMTIPSGTQSGQVFRLRGRGCPRLSGRGRGDLYVATRVDIPRVVNPEGEDAVRHLGNLYPQHPRSGLETSALARERRHGG